MAHACSGVSCTFRFGERLGIFVTVLASTFSAISVIGLLIYAALKRWRPSKHTSGHDTSDASAFILLLSLLAADLMQAIGGTPSWKWMLDAHITEGPLCTFQSLLLNIGNVSIALSALSIALQTFCVLILRWNFSRLTLRIVVASIWCFTALIIGVCSRGQNHYYGNAGYWCWITEDYFVERITGGYLWMWTAFFVMIALYAFMFLVMRDVIKIGNDADDSSGTAPSSRQEQEDERESKRIAYLMLFYPVVYLFYIAPISICRWIDWSRPNYLQPAAFIISHIIFSLSGVLNVILFSITRPSLVAGSTESLVDGEKVHQNPSDEIHRSVPPLSSSHKPIIDVSQSIAGKGSESSRERSLDCSVGVEHKPHEYLPPRVPPQTKTATKSAHMSYNHARLPDC